MQKQLDKNKQQMSYLMHALDTVSPLSTLNRGYSIVMTEDGKIVRNAKDVKKDDRVEARLGKGRLKCVVEEVVSK